MHAEPCRRGTLVAVQPGAGFTAPPPAYIADHDTAPQQVVRNDPTSVLIRTLQNKKAKEDAKRKQARPAGAAGRCARCGGRSVDEGRCGATPACGMAGWGGRPVGGGAGRLHARSGKMNTISSCWQLACNVLVPAAS